MAPHDLISSRAVFFAYPSRTYLKIGGLYTMVTTSGRLFGRFGVIGVWND